MSLLNDLDLFLDARLGAEEVTVMLSDNTEHSFLAYFDAPYAAYGLGNSFSMQSAGYQLICKASDAVGWENGSTTVTVAGCRYLVEAVMPDGTGMAKVALSSPAEVVGVEY